MKKAVWNALPAVCTLPDTRKSNHNIQNHRKPDFISSFALRTACLFTMVILLQRSSSLRESSSAFIILCLEHPNPLFAQGCLYFEVLNHWKRTLHRPTAKKWLWSFGVSKYIHGGLISPCLGNHFTSVQNELQAFPFWFSWVLTPFMG